jgi:hypothetical protein
MPGGLVFMQISFAGQLVNKFNCITIKTLRFLGVLRLKDFFYGRPHGRQAGRVPFMPFFILSFPLNLLGMSIHKIPL